jgi:thiol-disulfide isomerase/thioredoxin
MTLAPLFSFLAFVALLLKLPGISEAFCPTCSETSPWLPLIGGAYFSWLTAYFLLAGSKITPLIQRTGLIWAIALAFFLILPSGSLCIPCLIAHGCHITSWLLIQKKEAQVEVSEPSSPLSIFAMGAAPFLGASFILSLNLSLLLYGLPSSLFPPSIIQENSSVNGLKTSYLTDKDFSGYENTLLLFAGPGCPHCKKLFPYLQAIALKEPKSRFVLLSRQVNDEMKEDLGAFEMIEDPAGTLIKEWGIPGFPTLVIINRDAKVVKVITGGLEDAARQVQETLKASR